MLGRDLIAAWAKEGQSAGRRTRVLSRRPSLSAGRVPPGVCTISTDVHSRPCFWRASDHERHEHGAAEKAEGTEVRTDILRFLRALRCSVFTQFARPALGRTHNPIDRLGITGHRGSRRFSSCASPPLEPDSEIWGTSPHRNGARGIGSRRSAAVPSGVAMDASHCRDATCHRTGHPHPPPARTGTPPALQEAPAGANHRAAVDPRTWSAFPCRS
jgi:hypothetical protein